MDTSAGIVKLNFKIPPKEPTTLGRIDAPWADGAVATAIGEVPRVSTTLLTSDRLGSWKARWGIGRMRYIVEPGLYATGRPTPDSPVLVSANYKLSFDRLRSELGATDAWIMVLDTKGINVWCAAGKGTFGTEEIIRRIEAAGLDRIVSHRRLVVPQLGAPGVSAHEVRKQSGFRVIYGPVRAKDLPAFLSSGMKATQEMRRVRFPFKDRVALIPMEIVPGTKYAVPVAAGFLLLAGLGPDGYSFMKLAAVGLKSAAFVIGAFLAGSVIAPALLPWLPGKAFSVKGTWVGLALAAALACYGWLRPGLFENDLAAASWVLIIPALASFMAMNFTGASTYTSLSGVKREMRVAVPAQITGAVLGTGMWIGGLFV